jgi:hypothetical protein
MDDVVSFAQASQDILVTRGLGDMLRRWKASLFIVQAFLAGSPVKDSRPLGATVALANGLPSWLPLRARLAIRRRNPKAIRFWLTMLYAYKGVAWSPVKVGDVSTIEAPMPKISEIEEFAAFAGEFWSWAFEAYPAMPFVPRLQGLPRQVFTTSPTGAENSLLDAGVCALLWEDQPRNYLREYLELTSSGQLLAYYKEVLQRAREYYVAVELPLAERHARFAERAIRRFAHTVGQKDFQVALARLGIPVEQTRHTKEWRQIVGLQHAAELLEHFNLDEVKVVYVTPEEFT